ncbi:MAG: hypothetical protein HZC41_05830 [Chloroflexi bacterium]|nr:hypothetical protein [Chloroflexota bacterium]
MFPPMTPLTERVRIEFASRQLEQPEAMIAAVPPRAEWFTRLRRWFSRRAALRTCARRPAPPAVYPTASALSALGDTE